MKNQAINLMFNVSEMKTIYAAKLKLKDYVNCLSECDLFGITVDDWIEAVEGGIKMKIKAAA